MANTLELRDAADIDYKIALAAVRAAYAAYQASICKSDATRRYAWKVYDEAYKRYRKAGYRLDISLTRLIEVSGRYADGSVTI